MRIERAVILPSVSQPCRTDLSRTSPAKERVYSASSYLLFSIYRPVSHYLVLAHPSKHLHVSLACLKMAISPHSHEKRVPVQHAAPPSYPTARHVHPG